MTDRAVATVQRRYGAYVARDAEAYADCFARVGFVKQDC